LLNLDCVDRVDRVDHDDTAMILVRGFDFATDHDAAFDSVSHFIPGQGGFSFSPGTSIINIHTGWIWDLNQQSHDAVEAPA